MEGVCKDNVKMKKIVCGVKYFLVGTVILYFPRNPFVSNVT
jgi:hypothetical protein